ncbi:hypothetical protein [Achromobacter piechaudii]|uniref:hypothetical protein n=1 Tax=Achromobacter piechaudii TaxID=72556 RepID=UPI0012F4D1F3|nr:hypothetical protein [Achromobacter piechaudii]
MWEEVFYTVLEAPCLIQHVAGHDERLDLKALPMTVKDKTRTSIWSIAIAGIVIGILAWTTVPSPTHATPPQSDNKSADVKTAAPQSAPPVVSTAPLSAASAIAEGEALVNRAKEDEAVGKALLAGKSPSKQLSVPITTEEWANAKRSLGSIEKSSPEYSKAQALLKAMATHDKKNAEFLAAYEAKAKIDSRKKFATRLEQAFLDTRMNVDVSTSGTQHTVLRIEYVLASKVTANDLAKSGIVAEARSAGFKKVLFTDGYDKTWTWKLD